MPRLITTLATTMSITNQRQEQQESRPPKARRNSTYQESWNNCAPEGASSGSPIPGRCAMSRSSWRSAQRHLGARHRVDETSAVARRIPSVCATRTFGKRQARPVVHALIQRRPRMTKKVKEQCEPDQNARWAARPGLARRAEKQREHDDDAGGREAVTITSRGWALSESNATSAVSCTRRPVAPASPVPPRSMASDWRVRTCL